MRTDKDPIGKTSELGASLVEYSILIASIALVLISGVTFLGQTLRDKYFSTFPGMFG